MGPGRGARQQSAAAQYAVPTNMTLREAQQQQDSPPSSLQHREKQQGDNEVVPRALHNHGRGSMGDLVLSTANNTTNPRQKMEESLYHSSSGPGAANLLQAVNLMPQSQPLALCRALSDFNPSTMDLEDYKYCLRFLKGDILTVVRRVDEHWIEAKLGDKVGILPLQFTEPNSAAVKLLEGKNRKGRDSSEFGQRTGSGSKDKVADAPDRTNHYGVLQLPAKTPTINALPPPSQGKQLGVGSSAIYQPANICTFNGPQGPTPHLSTAPASANHGPAPPSRVACQHVKGRSDGTHRPLSQGEKKMNSEPPPTISMALVNPQVTPPSTDSKNSSSSTQQLSISVCATLYSYKPRRPEELELRKGEMVGVYGKFKEGWLRGLSLRTGKVGILPGSYVTPVLRTSARLLETNSATTSSPAAVKRPTASRNPAVVLALDRVNTDGTMYSTGQVPSVLNGAQHAAPSALYGVSQGWDTVRRAFNPHRGSTQQGNHYIHTSTSSHLSHSHNFAQVQASGCSPALQRKKHGSILPSPGRPLGRMSDATAPPAGTIPNGRDFTGLKEATFDRKPFTNGPHSILVRPDSHKNNTDKPVKSVRFFTDEDPSPPRLRASSWSSGGHQASSAGRPGSLPLEVWAPSLTLGRDGPGIVLKEGKSPVLRKGLETTISDLNSGLQKPLSSQTSLSAASAQFSPSRHRVTTTYLAQTDSELSLLQGELVLVHRPRPDGRVLITQECSGLTGLFYSNVLQAMERLS